MQIEAIPMLINGDFLNAPLDVKMHLADYKMYGEDSYVFQQKELLHELYECTYLSMNDTDLLNEAFDYLLKNNKHIGETLSAVYGIDGKETLVTLSTMTAIANSSTAMTAIANSSTAMTGICKASYDFTKAFIKVVNDNTEYIKKIFEVITTNTDKFQIVVNKYEDGVGNLNPHCNKPNTIILCALGYYNNSSSASVNLFINGEKVKTSNSAGSNPQNVTKSNCNAIAVPAATFTENSDAYAAIAVYKAI